MKRLIYPAILAYILLLATVALVDLDAWKATAQNWIADSHQVVLDSDPGGVRRAGKSLQQALDDGDIGGAVDDPAEITIVNNVGDVLKGLGTTQWEVGAHNDGSIVNFSQVALPAPDLFGEGGPEYVLSYNRTTGKVGWVLNYTDVHPDDNPLSTVCIGKDFTKLCGQLEFLITFDNAAARLENTLNPGTFDAAPNASEPDYEATSPISQKPATHDDYAKYDPTNDDGILIPRDGPGGAYQLDPEFGWTYGCLMSLHLSVGTGGILSPVGSSIDTERTQTFGMGSFPAFGKFRQHHFDLTSKLEADNATSTPNDGSNPYWYWLVQRWGGNAADGGTGQFTLLLDAQDQSDDARYLGPYTPDSVDADGSAEFPDTCLSGTCAAPSPASDPYDFDSVTSDAAIFSTDNGGATNIGGFTDDCFLSRRPYSKAELCRIANWGIAGENDTSRNVCTE